MFSKCRHCLHSKTLYFGNWTNKSTASILIYRKSILQSPAINGLDFHKGICHMWMFSTTKLYFLWMNHLTFHTYFTPKYILHVTNQKKYGVKCDIMSGLYLILKFFLTYMALSYHQVDTPTSLILSTGAKTFWVWQIWGWNWMNFRIKQNMILNPG